MGRWEPDAAGRLRRAAMELFEEHGYENVTVAEIADRAGLTSRTFFRYFADKREVLFGGSELMEERMVAALAAAAPDATPLGAVGAALLAATDLLGGDRDWSRRRHALIGANAELAERELNKLARLAKALAAALGERGVPQTEATMAAETGSLVFRLAFAEWVTSPDDDLATVMRAGIDRLRALTWQK